MTTGDRFDCSTPAAEKYGAQRKEVVGVVHARIWGLGFEGNGVKGLGGDNP